MKLAIVSHKYTRSLFTFGLMFVLFASIGIMVIVFEDKPVKKIALATVMLVFSFLMGWLTAHLLRIRKHRNEVLSLEGNILVIHTNPFGSGKPILLEEIVSIEQGQRGKYLQFKLEMKSPNRSKLAIVNQIKGNDVYLTDSLVDADELVQFVQAVEDRRSNLKM